MRILGLLIFLLAHGLYGQYSLSETDEQKIKKAFFKQQDDWNKADIEGFMQAYHYSDSIVFNGSSGPRYGWQNIKDRYIRNYPDPEAMGKLKFEIQKLYRVEESIAVLIGKFHLTRTSGDLSGFYTLVWKKFGEDWFVISDHTSAAASQ